MFHFIHNLCKVRGLHGVKMEAAASSNTLLNLRDRMTSQPNIPLIKIYVFRARKIVQKLVVKGFLFYTRLLLVFDTFRNVSHVRRHATPWGYKNYGFIL